MRKGILLVLALVFCSVNLTYAQKSKKDKSSDEEESYYLDDISLSGLSFRSVGPALTSGRISDVAVHPDNRAIYYVATSSGGVWKTENAGTTYEPIFDGQGSYSIGCITMDPNNPNVIWVGTGENNNQRSVAYGDGIYKSEDGGASWTHMGLKESEHIGRIIVDPRDSRTVYVAAIGPLWSEGGDRGVYKTTDGGENWEAVLTIDEHTGVTDIVMDPRDPDVIYAAAFQRRRHVFTYVGGGPESGMYKTSDGGENWKKINKGLPGGDIGRIGLAISPADPEIIYAMVEAAGNTSGFFKSTNRGASWQKQSGYFTRGNYYSEIVAHPTDPDIVYAMDTWMHVTHDGGKSFERVGERTKHVDNHSLYIDPDYPNYLLAGCDGGLYETFDAGKTWEFKDNLPVTQFYKVEVDNAQPFYNIYGGTQDNFSLGGPSRTSSAHGITNEDWYVTNGGDGFESQIDPNNPNIVYAQSQYGNLVRYDVASGERMGIQPKPEEGEDAYRWNWDAPLAVSAHQPTRIYFAANKLFRSDDRGNTWETISPDLTRQIDRNTLPVMGRIQSIDAVAKNASTSEYGTIVAFAESPHDPDHLYVGTDDGLIQITTDGGANWTEVGSFPGVPEHTYVNHLLVSQHDENTVYATFNNHKRGDFKPYVYVSRDGGSSWQSISSDLPERGSTYSLAEDHVEADLLFVGTEFGCFTSLDGGGHWKALKAGLPTIAVRDIAIQKRENDLVLGTFGRGFYVMDDYSPLREIDEELAEDDGVIFPIRDGLLYVESRRLGLDGKAFMGDSYFTAPNPEMGVTFTWYLPETPQTLEQKRKKEEKEKIKEGEEIRYPTYEERLAEKREEDPRMMFVIQDASGEIIRFLETKPRKGVNRTTWDGRYPSKRPVRLGGSGQYNPFSNAPVGIMAMPGEYTVFMALETDGEPRQLTEPVSFRLESLGGVTLPAASREGLVEFQAEAAELQRQYMGATRRLSEMSDRLKYMEVAALAVDQPMDEVLFEIAEFEEDLYDLRTQIFGDRVASELDQPQPYSISSRIGYLSYEMFSSTSAPTNTQREALRIASKEFAPVKEQIDRFYTERIEMIETQLEEAGAPYTKGR
ncbi:MAG: glycosyl hydrolase [Bacteroidetes bacterium]|nr:glycosyl hydrolase [Bacteroidota bacterium]